MIVRMSKLEIAGPKGLLLDVLAVIRERGVFQPESDDSGFADRTMCDLLSLARDEQTVAQCFLLENLSRMTAVIIDILPSLATRDSCLDPLPVLGTVAALTEKHLAWCRGLAGTRGELQREREELGRYALILGAIGSLVAGSEPCDGLAFIGVTLREMKLADRLRELLGRLTDGEFSLTIVLAPDNTIVGLIALPGSHGERVKKVLGDEQFPDLPFPVPLIGLTLPERIRWLQTRLAETDEGIGEINDKLKRFAQQWLAIYRRLDQWLAERLSLVHTATAFHETRMCFVVHGWTRADAAAGLAELLAERFGGSVAVEEKRILEQELERVPVALKNPLFFRPFELFTRLLPLPRYASWDPTPFIGVFFPIFFGMMLGDAGHGLLLMTVALLMLRRQGVVGAVARILLISAGCAIVFGLLFGEIFGTAGARLLGLAPLVMDRRQAIMPMLMFSVALGASHVILGIALGLFTALRRRARSAAVARLAAIGLIICLAALVTALFIPSPRLSGTPIIAAAVLLLAILLLSGGVLAPLELVRHIGNIISYARIMAIGLSSALLAEAANHVAGLSGDLILGSLTAIVLHGVALVLGVFAPAIQALRLHLVEFCSKFVELGGRRFEPLHK